MLTHNAFLSQFPHPVEDLRWLCNPDTDLITHLAPFVRLQIPTTRALQQWLESLTRAPQPLIEFLEQNLRSNRLGHYFETLLAFYFNSFPGSEYQLVDHGHPLYRYEGNSRRTIGELDFVLASAGRLLHLEVAIKFYLGTVKDGRWQWLGPNPNDSLQKKLSHMSCHQLPLSQGYAGFASEISARKFLIKGALFRPWQPFSHKPDYPASYAHQNTPHLWIRIRSIADFFKAQPYAWHKLKKGEWLSCNSSQGTNLEMQKDFPPLPFMLTRWDSGCAHRVMVVSDQWPEV